MAATKGAGLLDCQWLDTTYCLSLCAPLPHLKTPQPVLPYPRSRLWVQIGQNHDNIRLGIYSRWPTTSFGYSLAKSGSVYWSPVRAIISHALYFLNPFFTAANIVEQIILQSGQNFTFFPQWTAPFFSFSIDWCYANFSIQLYWPMYVCITDQ